jgi:hypothetical protein
VGVVEGKTRDNTFYPTRLVKYDEENGLP